MREGKAQKTPQDQDFLEIEFEDAIQRFETKLGINIRNRDDLKIALTHSSYHREVGKKLSNSAEIRRRHSNLEIAGDALVNKLAQRWCADPKKPERKKIYTFLHGNVFLSRVALKVGMREVIRAGPGQLTSLKPEAQVRILADSLEAFLQLLEQENSGAAKKFFDTYMVTDTFITEIAPGLVSDYKEDTEAAISRLTGSSVNIVTLRQEKEAALQILVDGVIAMEIKRGVGTSDWNLKTAGVRFFLHSHPWLLWGYTDPVGLYYPQTSAYKRHNKESK